MEKVFVSWSGGKDCTLAAYQAMTNGFKVGYLINMATENGRKSWTHGLSSEVLKVQSRAMGIPLVQGRTTSEAYEDSFVKILLDLKQKGVTAGIFGDIDVQAHRDWVERVCRKAGMTAHLPLWQKDQNGLLRDFIAARFEAVVVNVRADLLGEEWLGRRIDADFVRDINKRKDLTPCGEAGEYHTFVINGPFFKHRVAIAETNKALRDGHWFLEILKCELKPK